jgi:translation initiation factor IF-2
MLGSASDAVILGFHVAKEPGVDASAKHEGVEIRLHNVIYELIDQVRNAMTGLLQPEIRETVRAEAEVKQVFRLGKTSKIAGCQVTRGTVREAYKARVKREDEVLYEGAIASMRHFQDSVSEISEGQECGIQLDGFLAFEPGDILEFYEIEELEQTL